MNCQVCPRPEVALYDICPACLWEQDVDLDQGWSSANGCDITAARTYWKRYVRFMRLGMEAMGCPWDGIVPPPQGWSWSEYGDR